MNAFYFGQEKTMCNLFALIAFNKETKRQADDIQHDNADQTLSQCYVRESCSEVFLVAYIFDFILNF